MQIDAASHAANAGYRVAVARSHTLVS